MSKKHDARRRVFINFGIITTSLVLSLIVAEVVIRIFYPQSYLYPRYESSIRYGMALPLNTTMIEELSGEWRFEYTTNEYGYRGKAVSVSNIYETPNIVVLGDSYSFGEGVNDGSEYPAVLGNLLTDDFNVVNLGVPGYGLTHQIRWYYEFGKLYDPEIIILQFSSNDPSDNLFDLITVIDKDRFVFQQSSRELSWLKDLLRDSVLQYSQLYNFVRDSAYRILRSRSINKNLDANKTETVKDRQESFYVELLEAFITDLHFWHKRVIFISVNNALDLFPTIKASVESLHAQNLLEYIPVEPWFEGISNFKSPEGHAWGEKAHRLIGEQLAKYILDTKDKVTANPRQGTHIPPVHNRY